jgi:hypothetical protein
MNAANLRQFHKSVCLSGKRTLHKTAAAIQNVERYSTTTVMMMMMCIKALQFPMQLEKLEKNLRDRRRKIHAKHDRFLKPLFSLVLLPSV